MDGFEVALIFGLVILLVAVMYLAHKIQKLHNHTRYLRHLVKKLEAKKKTQKPRGDDEGGG